MFVIHGMSNNIYLPQPCRLAWFQSAAALNFALHCKHTINIPDSKVHGAYMGPSWGRQDPGGPHVGHMNLVIRGIRYTISIYKVILSKPVRWQQPSWGLISWEIRALKYLKCMNLFKIISIFKCRFKGIRFPIISTWLAHDRFTFIIRFI